MSQSVAGRTVQRSLADLEKAALVILGEHAVNHLIMDSALVGVLSDTVRLCREYADQMTKAKGLLEVRPDTHKLAARLIPIAELAVKVHDDLFLFACGQGLFSKSGRELACGDINELGRLAGNALHDLRHAAPPAPPVAPAPPAAPLTITLPHRLNLHHHGGCHMVAIPGGDFIKANEIKARLIAAGITVIEET
jgi:hypothetical protein